MKHPTIQLGQVIAALLWCAYFAPFQATPAVGQQPSAPTPRDVTASPSQIDRWIAQLSDDSFTIRQAAAEQLIAAGAVARRPLLKYVDGPDPELRAASRRIISLIETAGIRRQLDAFAADTDGSAGLTLPGWEQFKKIVGGDARARALFVEMQRQDSALLAAAFPEPSSGYAAAWEARLNRIVQWQLLAGRSPSPPLASCATVIFLACGPVRPASDQVVESLTNFLFRSPFQEALRTGDHRDALRRLVAAWIVNCPNDSEASVQQRLNVANAYQLAEVVPLAVAIALGRDNFRAASTSTRMTALMFVAQFGERKHVDALEPLLNDFSVCFSAERTSLRIGAVINSDVQIRDVALVVMLQLTNQRAVDYGYLHAQRPTGRELNPELMFPRSDEQRRQAIEKWRQWQAEQE